VSFVKKLWRTFLVVTLRDFWWVEFLSAIALCVWGMVALSSPDRLSARHFGALLFWCSEHHLEQIVLFVGALQFFCVVLHNRNGRVGCNFLASFVTGAMFLAIILAPNYPQPGVGYYGVMWAGNFLASIKLLRKRDDT
jgi:hypothetical protein